MNIEGFARPNKYADLASTFAVIALNKILFSQIKNIDVFFFYFSYVEGAHKKMFKGGAS